MIEAIERIRGVVGETRVETFEADWRGKWLVERGIEIISEASRHLPQEIKDRHPDIPWRKVAGIGNVLRHDYGQIAAPLIWKLATSDLSSLEAVCQVELARLRSDGSE